jgi:hypothetical protein
MISQSAFSAGAGAVGADEVAVGAAAVGAGAVAVGAGAVAVADGQGVAVAGTGIVVEDPADALPAPAGVVPAAAGAEADVADPAAAGLRQGFAGAAALADASSTVLTRGIKTAAIPTPSTTARSPIISAGRARGGRSSWFR